MHAQGHLRECGTHTSSQVSLCRHVRYVLHIQIPIISDEFVLSALFTFVFRVHGENQVSFTRLYPDYKGRALLQLLNTKFEVDLFCSMASQFLTWDRHRSELMPENEAFSQARRGLL